MKLLIDISEEEYKEVLEDTYSGTPFENKIFTIIANGTPYEEEERPHGEWIKKVDDVGFVSYICNKCGFELELEDCSDSYYCTICGAKMKEAENEC